MQYIKYQFYCDNCFSFSAIINQTAILFFETPFYILASTLQFTDLMEKSVKELRRVAVEKAVNTNHCIEKSELVSAIPYAEEQRITSEEITIINVSSSSSDSPNVSANEQSLKGYSSDDGNATGSSKRRHRKSNNPSRRKSNFSLRQDVDLDVQQLPYDIDGLVAFRLAFDPKQRMQSSKDGRHWAT